jgi:hypothetical protein
MAWIGVSQGIFNLHDSDNWCGSFISISDACDILHVTAGDLSHLPKKEFENQTYVSELILHQEWSSGRLQTPLPPKIGNATRSLDELIIARLFEVNLPGCVIEYQVKFNRKHVDLCVSYKDQKKYIEFVGPSHFIPQYQRPVISPLQRKIEVEDFFAQECVIWPYWIQRCSRNIQAIFSENRSGLASVWSTKAHFGDFVFPESASLIISITDRFGAIREDGIGYMYGNSHTNKPVHPIVEAIKQGKQSIDRLIPWGNIQHMDYWLPQELRSTNSAPYGMM